MGDVADYSRAPRPVMVEGAVSAHDLACADLANWGDAPMVAPAMELLAERKAYGFRKYEVILHADNGRPHVQDAIDEAADLVVYLRCTLDEKPEIRAYIAPLYRNTLWTLVCLLAVRDGRRLPERYEQLHGPLVEINELREGMEIPVQ